MQKFFMEFGSSAEEEKWYAVACEALNNWKFKAQFHHRVTVIHTDGNVIKRIEWWRREY